MLALWFIGSVVTRVLFFLFYCHLVSKWKIYEAWFLIGEQSYTVTFILFYLIVGLPLDIWLGINRNWPMNFIIYESILGSILVYADVVMTLRYSDMDEGKKLKIRVAAATIIALLTNIARVKLSVLPSVIT